MSLKQTLKPQQRKSRYRRDSTVKLRIQERDIKIIKLLYEHRFLSSEHFKVLIPGSNQGILRRLNLLFHNGYLDRPPKQINPFQKGSDPMVYALGNKGADLLAQRFSIHRDKVDWTSKNRDVGGLYLEHTLLVSQFMTCLNLACANDKRVEIIQKDQILKTTSTSKQTSIKWEVAVKREFKGKLRTFNYNIIPDNFFGLYFPNDPPPNKAFFFLEADRSTMPIKRRSLFGSSYLKKLLGYQVSWKDNHFQKNFGFKMARVLTITKSEDRIENMIEACKEIDERRKGLRMFLFTSIRNINLKSPERILGKIWLTPRGETVSIVD